MNSQNNQGVLVPGVFNPADQSLAQQQPASLERQSKTISLLPRVRPSRADTWWHETLDVGGLDGSVCSGWKT